MSYFICAIEVEEKTEPFVMSGELTGFHIAYLKAQVLKNIK
jgi:hypothetical protein